MKKNESSRFVARAFSCKKLLKCVILFWGKNWFYGESTLWDKRLRNYFKIKNLYV